MSKHRLTAGITALALGSLLIIGAGCANGEESSERNDAPAPRTGTVTRERAGQPDYRPTPAGGADQAPGSSAPSTSPSESMAPDTSPAREITVTATSFAFSPAEIRVKKGEKIKLTLTNAGGTHGIGIPAFNVDLRAGEGESASTTFVADQTGSFPFFCNVFCGGGHREMRGTLIVE